MRYTTYLLFLVGAAVSALAQEKYGMDTTLPPLPDESIFMPYGDPSLPESTSWSRDAVISMWKEPVWGTGNNMW